MENLEPKKERSPIESLKFQRKSDYKKFRNFIKKETKELKGIVEPKEDKLKNILNVGAVGLGLFTIGGLIGAIKGKDNEDTSPKFKTPFIVGKRNPKDLPDPKRIFPNLAFSDSIAKTSKIPKPVKTPAPVQTTQSTLLKTKEFSKVQEKSRELVTSGKSKSGKMGASAADKDFFKRLKLDPKLGERGVGAKNLGAITVDEAEKLLADLLGEPEKKLNIQRDTQLPIRTKGKGSLTLEQQATNAILNLPDTEADDLMNKAALDKGMGKKVGVEQLMDEINNTKELRMDPSYNRVKIKAEISFEYMKRRLSQLKSKGSKIFGSISKTTQKLTPQFLKSDLVKPLFKSKTKTGFFVIDLLFAGQAFADLFKPKDNLRTSVVDLFNAYNNLKYKDDPSKLKYYITESSDERVRAFHIQKNKEIRLLKEQAGVDLGGPQNILIVPDNKQNNEVKTDTSIKKGETKISFVPFEPVNSVGTGILLHKLNA